MFNPLNGVNLELAVRNRPPARDALIEGLLYRNTATMLAADPATGKSTVITQAMLQLTSGEPVFGYYHVPMPRNVYYLQLEGSLDETLERIGYMSSMIGIDYNRLCWDMPTLLNCLDEKSVLEIMQ